MTGRIHGTRTAYRDGCRCDICRTAESDLQHAYRNRKPVTPPPPYVTTEDWMRSGSCRAADVNPAWFFPPKGASTNPAKQVCNRCPVQHDCLEYAIRHTIRHGIFGGLSERARQKIRQDRRRGAA